jgi:hypothetical protein
MRFTLEHLTRPFRRHKEYYTLVIIFAGFAALRLFSCIFLPPPPPLPRAPTPTPTPTATETPDAKTQQLQALWGNVYGPTPIAELTPMQDPAISQLNDLMQQP